MKNVKKNKELLLFITVAYGVTFLMGIVMWYGNSKKLDLGILANAQMFYPAAGVMLAVICTRKNDAMIPKTFYVFFICVAAVSAALAVASLLNPYAMIVANNGYVLPIWLLASQVLIISSGIAGWIILLATKKEKRRAYVLCWNHTAASWFCIVLFLTLYLFRTAIAVLCSNEWEMLTDVVSKPYTWVRLAVMPVNFCLLYTVFLGEEYGWRYYLQPLMQCRFGVRRGVLLLGVVWGIWHLPVDLFYYTQDSQFLMILAQQVTCITLGIFFAYAYMKTDNIWVPTVLHFMNNNLVPVITDNYTAGVLENQTITWGELMVSLVINGLIFGVFLLTKPFQKATKKAEE